MDPVGTVTKKESHIVSGYVSSIKVGHKPPCNVILILTKESLLKFHSEGNYQGHWMMYSLFNPSMTTDFGYEGCAGQTTALSMEPRW